ncbi:MAG: NAD-dependent epimerase/dehydratase family protein [Comamonas sp.]|jgi:nucleoside-diphosphate-sugar epimerase|uniref:NAD-dependent epimerase/dehydratase family protein n=1 Tax=Comamonas sp. TaxID=34028 RepID=UPI00284E7996|nr:NAD-dependent epimerase/dehydratase family protein [Comamonas sp.]MDR3065188.1 NAD-dependent epimerase/dehydratase family protein [Comamonas sp.]
MKILVVGGTGLLGGHAALHLQSLGHQVSIAARKPAPAGTPMAQLPFKTIDYVSGRTRPEELQGFDAMVFAAGNDIRHVPPDSDAAAHWLHANGEALPRFFALARDAGVRKAVLIGSFYPQLDIRLTERDPYVRSRHLACVGVRALATPGFEVCSLNAPFMVGAVSGLPSPIFEAYTAYAQGRLGDIPVFGPTGGTNFMSVRSLSEAIAGALENGESGKAYLLGDENLRFSDFFKLFFEAVGSDTQVPEKDESHPLMPDAVIYAGRGTPVNYQPSAEAQKHLNYRRNDIRAAVRQAVEQVLGAQLQSA